MILNPTPENIRRSCEAIRNGELVVFPTETVYGIGADASNESAVKKIFELKGRPSFNPLIVHLHSPDSILKYSVVDKTKRAFLDKLSNYWPGPLSVVLPVNAGIAPSVTAGLNSVAFRIPNHPIALELLREVGTPIAAPSANTSNYVSATNARHVHDEFREKVSIILDGGDCAVGIESTIVSLLEESPIILRPGYISAEELSDALLTPIETLLRRSSSSAIESPGQLPIHYAPRTKLSFADEVSGDLGSLKVGFISFGKVDDKRPHLPYSHICELSVTRDLSEVARGLFAALRKLDSLGLDLILIDRCSNTGLGRAIMDRIYRATSKTK